MNGPFVCLAFGQFPHTLSALLTNGQIQPLRKFIMRIIFPS
ncbi:hypothetical protein EMIT0P176_190019 [Pseudomonas sp. IT-P176]